MAPLTMKPHHQAAMTKLSDVVRVIFSMSKKRFMVDIGLAMAKCKLLWKGFLGTGVPRRHLVQSRSRSYDDFQGSYYEFSCRSTPIMAKHNRRQQRLPPCVCSKEVEDMAAASSYIVIPRIEDSSLVSLEEQQHCCSSNYSSEEEEVERYEIDGLAEDFITKFHEQLRMQKHTEQKPAYDDMAVSEKAVGIVYEIDGRAEDFIREFHEQLRMQS